MNGPTLRYTNERAREMEKNVAGFAKLVNDDLYDLLKWAAELQEQRDAALDALERLHANAGHIFDKTPVRGWAETLAESESVLTEAGRLPHERRAHRRIHDWDDQLRNDRRIT